MEKTKRKRLLPTKLIAFVLSFAMVVSVLAGALPGTKMTAKAAADTIVLTEFTKWEGRYIDSDLTVDLNGYALAVSDGITIDNATLTIKDSSEAEDGQAYIEAFYPDHNSDGYPAIMGYGTAQFIIESGTVYAIGSAGGNGEEGPFGDGGNGGPGIQCDVTISGGKLESRGGYGGTAYNQSFTNGQDGKAIIGTVKNSFAGTGWTTLEQQDDGTIIPVSESGQTLDDYYVACFVAPGPTEWSVGDNINLHGKWFIYDDSGVTSYESSSESTEVPKPEYSSIVSAWVFADCISASVADESNPDPVSLYFAVPEGKTEADVPTGFKVKSGDGTEDSPYLFELVYSDEPEVPVESVTLDKETATVVVDKAVALHVDVQPETATDKKVIWASDNPSVELYTDEECTKAVGSEATDVLSVYAKGASIGSAIVTATSVESHEGDDLYDLCEVKVTDAPALTVSIEDWTYGDDASDPVVRGIPAGTELKDVIIEYKPFGAKNSEYNTKVPETAGKYNIRATLPDSAYGEAVSEDVFNIVPVTVTLKWSEETTHVYDGKEFAPTVEVEGLLGEDECTATVSGKASAVGKYTAEATGLSNTNYQLPDDETVKCPFEIVKVSKKENPATLTMESWIYGDGAPDPVVEGNIGGGTVNFKYATVDEESWAQVIAALVLPEIFDYDTNVKPTDAGFYIVKAEIGETENYEAVDLYKTFSITKKTVELEWDPDTLIFRFDNEEHIPTCTISNLEYGDKVDVDLEVTDGPAKKVGTYTAVATALTGDAAKNYKLSGEEEQNKKEFKITTNKFDFIVVMQGWTYGDEANEPEVVFLDGDYEPTITYYTDEERKNKTTADDGAAKEGEIPSYAGTYYVEAKLEVEGYVPHTAITSFAIEQRQLGVKWTDTSFEYDGTEHIPTAEATNAAPDDEVKFDVTEAKKDAGEYEAKITFMAGEKNKRNYKLPEVTTQTFKIAKREAKLEWGENVFDYDGVDHWPTATVANLVEGDDCYVTVTGGTSAVGFHIVTATKLGNANYELPNMTMWMFLINKGTLEDLELTIEDWTYGDTPNEPVLKGNIGGGTVNYSYTALDSWEKVIEWLKDPESHDIDYSTGKPTKAGFYVVRAEVGETDNYESGITYAGLTISKKTVQLKWDEMLSFAYDGLDHVPECTLEGIVPGDDCDVVVSGEAKEVGNHTAKAEELTGKDASNYKLPTTVTQTFAITQGQPEFLVLMPGWTYGDEPNDPLAVGVTGDADVEFTFYTDADCQIPTDEDDGAEEEGGRPVCAGTYFVVGSVEETESYVSMSAMTEFTIEQRQLGVKWSDGGFIYNGKPQVPEATATNVVEGDEVEFEVSGEGTNVGEYEAMITFMPGDDVRRDYKLPENTTRPFKISPLEAKIEWSTTAFEYTGTEQCPEAKITNLIEGDKCKIIVTGAAISIGTHLAQVVRLTNKNYEIPEDAEQEFEILKAAQFINAKDMKLKFGQTKAINAEASGGGELSYKLKSGKNVIKLNADGTVTALKEGKAVVEIKAAETPYCTEAVRTINVTVVSDVINIYRVYNPNSGEHVYTKSASEKDSLVKAGWKDEGVAWKSPAKSNTPVYRLYNANAGDHHYTISKDEKANLIKAGWKDEGIVWYSDDLKTAPVYRVYNPNATTGSHHFTKSQDEVKKLVKAGWQDEAVAFYSK